MEKKSRWKVCKKIRKSGYDGKSSWIGGKTLNIAFKAEDGDYLTLCFNGSLSTKCQHVRLTEDEAEWFFETGKEIIAERIKGRQEEDEKEKKKEKEPTKEDLFQKELEERRAATERERKKQAKKLAAKLWNEIEQTKATPATSMNEKRKRGRTRKTPLPPQ